MRRLRDDDVRDPRRHLVAAISSNISVTKSENKAAVLDERVRGVPHKASEQYSTDATEQYLTDAILTVPDESA